MDLSKHTRGVLMHSGYQTVADVMKYQNQLEKLKTGEFFFLFSMIFRAFAGGGLVAVH